MPVRPTPVMRSNHLSTLGLPIQSNNSTIYNNCSNTLCYTYNHSYIYKPHTAYGMVGTSAAGYLARRKRL